MPKELKLYGTIHNIQYRTILCVFHKMEKKITEEHVEVIEEHQKDPKYTGENPSQTIPMLEDGFFKVLGGSHLIYSYLMRRFHDEIGAKLMPQ